MIYHGDLFDVLLTLADESIDACVTDGPYGIGFMSKQWDTFKPGEEAKRIIPNQEIDSDNPNLNGRTRAPASSPSAVEYDYSAKGLRAFQAFSEQWGREVFRVLKPGAHVLSCGAPRAYHRMACGLEDAGFEIRDCLAWLFGSGFPKSLNLGEGLGTALKPAHEPIVLARKPFKGTVRANVEKFGTGALNIDACRIEHDGSGVLGNHGQHPENHQTQPGSNGTTMGTGWNRPGSERNDLGRWPANVALDEIAALVLDEQSGYLQAGASPPKNGLGSDRVYGDAERAGVEKERDELDAGGASRFYYVAKSSREERDYGCSGLAQRTAGECTDRREGSDGLKNPRAGAGRTGGGRNFHPTVKPVELMRWLVKLITPINGTVLDPFMGSGTTGMACALEGREFIGIEREAEYIQIARCRIAATVPLFADNSAQHMSAVIQAEQPAPEAHIEAQGNLWDIEEST